MDLIAARKKLSQIADLARRTDRLNDAEQMIMRFLDQVDPVSLAKCSGDLKKLVDEQFLPKRRRKLLARLTELLEGTAVGGEGAEPDLPLVTRSQLDDISTDLATKFADLSEHRIFQWSTAYRDVISECFDQVIATSLTVRNPEALWQIVRDQVSSHSTEIFQKGYDYSIRRGYRTAITKSLNGLQRFVEVPVDVYSAQVARARAGRRSVALRGLCSAIVSGIVLGFADVRFDKPGASLLPKYTRSWMHYVAFINSRDLQMVGNKIEAGTIREGLLSICLVLTSGLDRLVSEQDEVRFGLPGLGQFNSDAKYLDVGLKPPTWVGSRDAVQVRAFLDATFVRTDHLEDAANRGIDIVLADFRPDMYDWAVSNDILRNSLVDVGDSSHGNPNVRFQELLDFAVSRQKTGAIVDAPLTVNFAKRFPLQNPFLAKYFHVYRVSIRRLLQGFENRNGVRLWCSVRRSGKTTACFDLGSSTGQATVISQTCDDTGQLEGASRFYDEVSEHLNQSKPLPRDFFENLVADVSPNEAHRYVFVLDEYETLFERLKLASKRDRELRYTIAQPLLNQMVAFSKTNLLIMIGQRPDAHFILMEQNQLSPYVEQDYFPLFEYEPSNPVTEFRDLLRKVLSHNVLVDDEFTKLVFRETGGHPYLTVNLLREFCEWLIESSWSVAKLRFTEKEYRHFAEKFLKDERLVTSPEYQFFRQAASQALGSATREAAPWLHAVYSCLRNIAIDSSAMQMSRKRFAEMVERTGLKSELRLSADHLLASGAMTNFFSYGHDWVRPKIPLLARLTRVCAPASDW